MDQDSLLPVEDTEQGGAGREEGLKFTGTPSKLESNIQAWLYLSPFPHRRGKHDKSLTDDFTLSGEHIQTRLLLKRKPGWIDSDEIIETEDRALHTWAVENFTQWRGENELPIKWASHGVVKHRIQQKTFSFQHACSHKVNISLFYSTFNLLFGQKHPPLYLWAPNRCRYLDLWWHTLPPLRLSPLFLLLPSHPRVVPCCQGLSVGLLAPSCQPLSSPGRTGIKWDITANTGWLLVAHEASSDHQAAVFIWWTHLWVSTHLQ